MQIGERGELIDLIMVHGLDYLHIGSSKEMSGYLDNISQESGVKNKVYRDLMFKVCE